MTDTILREYRSGDIPALIALWHKTFGDSEKLIGDFFRLLPEMGTGVVAELDGNIAGAAYIITGFQLINGESCRGCAYLYAVAVDEAFRSRGLGGALSREAARLGLARGAEIVCTLPAESSLYPWYADVLLLGHTVSRRKPESISDLPEKARAIGPEEYALLREELLCGKAHIRLAPAAMEFEYLLCRDYGGGFYKQDGSIFAAYKDGGVFSLRECLPGTSTGSFVDYIMSSAAMPDDLIWDLSFD